MMHTIFSRQTKTNNRQLIMKREKQKQVKNNLRERIKRVKNETHTQENLNVLIPVFVGYQPEPYWHNYNRVEQKQFLHELYKGFQNNYFDENSDLQFGIQNFIRDLKRKSNKPANKPAANKTTNANTTKKVTILNATQGTGSNVRLVPFVSVLNATQGNLKRQSGNKMRLVPL